MLRKFRIPALAFALVSLSACTFGGQADSQEEQELLLQTLLLSARGYLNLSLRTGAGETASMSDFTANGTAISLNSETSILVDKVELNVSGTSLLSASTATSIRRHGESGSVVAGSENTILVQNITLSPIASSGVSQDIFGQMYVLGGENVTELSAATINSIKVHISQITLKGTAGANNFTYTDSTAVDISLTPTCATTISLGGLTQFKLLINYSAYFANVAGDSESQVQDAALANRASTSLLEEHECLSL